ncbi:hypothetical protein V6Z11_D06G107300 [Gossypium hirsutum]
MSTETKANLVKMKPSGQDGSSKGKFDAAMNKRKLESSSKQPVGAKQKSATTKAEVKSKTSSSSSKTSTSSSKTSTTTKAKVREKKVYTLPGQKHDPPEEFREPLRIFYESLSKQIPKSEMAEFWMMEHGLLSPEKDRKAYEKKQRRQKQLRTGTPIKSWKPIGSRNGDVKAKKRIKNDIDDDDDDDDDDFILSPKRRKGIISCLL